MDLHGRNERGHTRAPAEGFGYASFTHASRSSGFLGQLTGPAIPTHISTSSSVRGLGAGLVSAWADADHGWESDVSGEAAF